LETAASVAFAVECDDCDARRLSVLQGLGIALMPDWSVGEDIGAGRLVELLPEGLRPQPQSGIYLLRAASRAPAKVKASYAHLTDSIGALIGAFGFGPRGAKVPKVAYQPFWDVRPH